MSKKPAASTLDESAEIWRMEGNPHFCWEVTVDGIAVPAIIADTKGGWVIVDLSVPWSSQKHRAKIFGRIAIHKLESFSQQQPPSLWDAKREELLSRKDTIIFEGRDEPQTTPR
jgi:hypothetical protein